jgi:hypothetical protein
MESPLHLKNMSGDCKQQYSKYFRTLAKRSHSINEKIIELNVSLWNYGAFDGANILFAIKN